MDGVGTIAKIEGGGKNIEVPSDMNLQFWPGGMVITEFLDNNGSATPKKEFKAGRILGLTPRLARDSALADLMELLRLSLDGPIDFLFELANGAKYSGPSRMATDPENFFNSDTGLAECQVCATETGIYNKVG